MMIYLNILLEGVESNAANIVKQEMLAVGGEAAVAPGKSGSAATDVIIMGTLKQIHNFTEKIARQPFGLRLISERIGEIMNNISSGFRSPPYIQEKD